MTDIAPKLFKEIKSDFLEKFDSDKTITAIYKKIDGGNATYKEVNEFAIRCGELLSGSFRECISSDILPDGRMYYNIADRIIRPMLENNYEIVSDVCKNVQNTLNKKAGIGIKAVTPEMNQDRVKGIIDIVSGKEKYDDIAYMLDEPIVNFTQSVVDDSIHANADFQYKAGMNPKIIRKSNGHCCKWCNKLAGIYNYEDVSDTGNNVFRRHNRCRCTVEYDPGKGKVQNVHTKKIRNLLKEDDRIKRITDAKRDGFRRASFRTARMSNEEYMLAKSMWNEYDEIDIPQSEKERIYEELDNNLTVEEKESALVHRPIGNYYYSAINKGHNQYKIIDMSLIEKPKDIVEEVLTEMFGEGWEKLL